MFSYLLSQTNKRVKKEKRKKKEKKERKKHTHTHNDCERSKIRSKHIKDSQESLFIMT